MTNRPKAIGTAGETAVVRYAREHGFPLADRLTLSGRYDRGDVQLTVGLVAEIKAGKAAQRASYNQVLAWLEETKTERVNARADVAVLIVQRQGYGVGRVGMWSMWTVDPLPWPCVACRTLEDGLRMLRHAGWGTALDTTSFTTHNAEREN
jgi:hypothetical protein